MWTIEVDSGNYVARRQDNDQINGTKLLNITRITRGKRDGILKNEKSRQVVKTGTISLKGVWIPLDRAMVLARQFGIEQALYPLFETNVGDYVENSAMSQHAIKRKSLNNLVDSLTTTRELVSKRRSTVSTYNPLVGGVGGMMSVPPPPPPPPHQYVDSFGYAAASPYEHSQSQSFDEPTYVQGRSRNTSSASDWMTNWSTSSSSPVIPATPINGTFSPVMNTFQSLALHSPPVPIPSYYYDSSSSYFPTYHQKQQQGERRGGRGVGVNLGTAASPDSNEYVQHVPQ